MKSSKKDRILEVVLLVIGIAFLGFWGCATYLCMIDAELASNGFLLFCIACDAVGVLLIALGVKKHKQITLKKSISEQNLLSENFSDSSEQNKNISNKTKKYIIGAIAIVIVIIAVFAYRSAQVKAAQEALLAEQEAQVQEVKDYNEYVDYMNQLYVQSLYGVSKAESVCVLTYNVWRDRIYSDYDDEETSAYTVGTEDFNEAIQNIYNDDDIKEQLSDIKKYQENTKYIIQQLQSCPQEISNAYDAALEVYTTFNALAELALSPTGNLNGYYTSEQNKIQNYSNSATTLLAVLPAKRSLPYFDEETETIASEFAFVECLNQPIDNLTDSVSVEECFSISSSYFQGKTEINGITGELSIIAVTNADIVSYITWSTDAQDQETVDEFVRRMTLVYGEEYQGEKIADNQHVWTENDGYYYVLEAKDDALQITWMYNYMG